MRQFLTPDDIANSIRMGQTVYKGSYLIVEGERDDRIISNFSHPSECRLLPANGKSNVLNVLNILETAMFRGAAAIVDSDFWKIDGGPPKTRNLFSTDYHDFEVQMIMSSALDRVVVEHARRNKVNELIRREGMSLRDILFGSASILGALRLLSTRQNLSLDFKNLDFSTFIDKKSLNIDKDKVISTVISNTAGTRIDESRIKRDLVDILNEDHAREQLCCGHDLIAILAIGLRFTLGNSRIHFTEPYIASDLRLSYPLEEIRRTELYGSLKEWEGTNQPFLLLHPSI
ncbi:MAG: DUF4435 domain-containing protein [Candidatus Thermoplasmatota archaeon]|nr:DUF4435 domain-containing protein [Candidatus Thermoplasmatota archaeon]